jgi:hypothetical protein
MSTAPILNRVCDARICGSAGHELSFAAGEIKTFVVYRGRLDREMAAYTTDADAKFLLKTCVTAINPEKRCFG